MRALRLGLLPLAAWAAPVLAHGGHDHPAEMPGWTLDPWITVPLAASAMLYAGGWLRLRRRAMRGGARLGRRAAWFAAGWIVLAAALVSPLHQAGERSFAAHMFEHELLMLVAAPLLVLARPLTAMLWAFPPAARRRLGAASHWSPVAACWRGLTAPVAATLIQAAALWLWHMPLLFDRALANEGWHAAQHLSFLVSALLFWTAMLGPRGSEARAAAVRGVAVLCLFATSIVSGALGALMAFSASPWYRGYAELGMAPFGLTPVEDQQLAGLLMWVPGGLVHAGAALLLVCGMLRPAPAEAHAHAL